MDSLRRGASVLIQVANSTADLEPRWDQRRGEGDLWAVDVKEGLGHSFGSPS
jgi:hypothetical protein